ncbi:MAG: hypothetical protein A2015_08725 [Spirochaetes bacterium GWF1_31_7]|nr:MAG: hypothetical protein A2Y30_06935 [Spirochaetes bacterium GWE1_32_154]OHD48005.1 MAG: hypothetical protein A2015_08725 [Spirochaetes bacterium GWF1_31_7]OHD49678.1 MAG: hypothetical protein A2Y29_06910 [Spirochaetes bacterium GWE2_31_10]OHD78844.1 MAG: hypothetical protein A2355_06355 [Spirochaetes bacterium RIFOXYB1_FULL_32_8]HBD92784.1 hypothetical protein [Spirochaetia bacterium]
MNRRIFLLLTFSFVFTSIYCKDPDNTSVKAGAKTLIAKNLKLTVWDDNGRFNVSSNIENRWEALFFNDYPSTNFMRFYLNNEVLDFGMGGGLNKSSIQIVDNSVVYEWSNQVVRIVLNYSFIKMDSELYDALKINVKVINLSSQSLTVSSLFCFDTYLGENTNSHFILPGDIAVNSEIEFSGNTVPSYIASDSITKTDQIKFYFDGSQETRPYRVFMANWKKVSERQGVYMVKEGESFNWGRFSFNDSALFVEYRNVPVKIDSEISRDFFIQNKSGVTENISVTPEVTKEVKQEAKQEVIIKDTKMDILPDIGTLTDLGIDDLLRLLTLINKKLDNESNITQNDIEYFDEILKVIEKKTNKSK